MKIIFAHCHASCAKKQPKTAKPCQNTTYRRPQTAERMAARATARKLVDPIRFARTEELLSWFAFSSHNSHSWPARNGAGLFDLLKANWFKGKARKRRLGATGDLERSRTGSRAVARAISAAVGAAGLFSSAAPGRSAAAHGGGLPASGGRIEPHPVGWDEAKPASGAAQAPLSGADRYFAPVGNAPPNSPEKY